MIDFSRALIKTYSDALGSDVFHYRISHAIGDGRELRGFGSGFTKESALKKATSEFFERASLILDGAKLGIKCSNGFAAHVSRELAIHAAKSELIERDIVLGCWLAKRAPCWLSPGDFELGPAAKFAFEKFSGNNLDCRFGLQGKVGDLWVVVSTLRPLESVGRFGFTFASAANTSLSAAVESLILNQRRNFTYLIGNPSHCNEPLPVTAIDSPGRHRDYYLFHPRATEVEWFFAEGSIFTEDAEPKIEFKEWPSSMAPPWPLFVYRAKSDHLQTYYVGLYRDEHLNKDRLRKFILGGGSAFNDQVHPLS